MTQPPNAMSTPPASNSISADTSVLGSLSDQTTRRLRIAMGMIAKHNNVNGTATGSRRAGADDVGQARAVTTRIPTTASNPSPELAYCAHRKPGSGPQFSLIRGIASTAHPDSCVKESQRMCEATPIATAMTRAMPCRHGRRVCRSARGTRQVSGSFARVARGAASKSPGRTRVHQTIVRATPRGRSITSIPSHEWVNS